MRARWLAALLFAGGLAVGLGVTGIAHAAGPAKAGKRWNEILLPFDNGRRSTMCVDVPGGSAAPGARLRLARCHGYASDGASQRWHFLGGRFRHVANTDSGLCIGFPDGGSPVAGARLVQERCDQVPIWQLVPQGRESRDGTGPLVVLETSGPGGPALCMAAADLSDAGATPLVALPCAGFQDAAQLLELG